MRRHKYYFDFQNLTYQPFKRNFWERILQISGILSISLILSIIVVVLLLFYYDSPTEKRLRREVVTYESKFEVMSKRLDRLKKVVNNLETRDEKIYRVIFEAEPLPDNVRNAGYGGVEHYKELKGLSHSSLVKQTAQKFDKLSKKLYILTKSYDEIAKLASKKKEMLASIPSIQPVPNEDLERVASGFGYRIHPIYKTSKFHEGIDFTAPHGTPIYATGKAQVVKRKYSKRGYGNQLVLNHGYGYKTEYAHLQSFKVKKGETVERGELIGTIGKSGLSTGPHLHYEVRKDGKAVNPINFFHNDLSPREYKKVVKLANRANQSMD